MNMIQPDNRIAPGEVHRRTNRIAGFFLHFVVPVAVLAGGIAITIYLMKTSPEARPAKRPPTATLVEVQPVRTGTQQTILDAMGEIVPAREIEIKPRVSGEVVEISGEFLPGGRFTAGDTLLTIDRTDYQLSLRQLQSEVKKAESDLMLEMGNQRIAAKEFALVRENVSPEEKALILRQPQLAKLQAALDSTRARLDQAKLDLERTAVKVPFNVVVHARNVEVGARVNESTVLATLVGTDAFWLRLTLPVDQLPWLTIPTGGGERGSEVRIHPQGGSADAFRLGEIARLEPALESQGRMAQIIVKIEDPLCFLPENRDKPPLLLGSFVRAELRGATVESAVSLDRSHLHDGTNVWLMNGEGQLEVREVEVLFRNREQVIVGNGLADGERLITTQLSSPVAGTPLRLAENGMERKGDQASGAQGANRQAKESGGAGHAQ